MKRKLSLAIMLSVLACYVLGTKASAKDNPKNSYIVWTYNKAEIDTTANSINLDSAKIAYFNRFISDSNRYYERDSLLQSDVDSLRSELLGLREKAEKGEYNGTGLWVRIMLFSLAFLLVATLFYFVLRLRGLRDEIVDVVKGSGRIKEWLNCSFEKPTAVTTSKSYDSDIRKLQNENRDLKDRVAQLEDAIRERKKESEATAVEQQSSSSRPVEAQKQLYADSIIDGVFSHVKEQENDDTVFVLNLKNENAASVSIFRQAYGKVLANASYLEGCEKQIIGNNSVVVVREGEAERGFNGKWKVVTPLKVEIR